MGERSAAAKPSTVTGATNGPVNPFEASPTTLIAMLKAVAYGWKQAALAESAAEVSALARELYDRLGTLAAGKTADVCVLDHNLFTCSPSEVLATQASLTVLGGQVVFEA